MSELSNTIYSLMDTLFHRIGDKTKVYLIEGTPSDVEAYKSRKEVKLDRIPQIGSGFTILSSVRGELDRVEPIRVVDVIYRTKEVGRKKTVVEEIDVFLGIEPEK